MQSWLPKNSIVVPIDFSEESLKAVEIALTMVRGPSRVHVIHVLPTISDAETGSQWGQIDEHARCEHAEETLRSRLSDERYQGVDVLVTVGDPGQEITEFAQSIVADLIVLPSHGRTGLARLLIGSVAERVVRLAHCPVLVLKK